MKAIARWTPPASFIRYLEAHPEDAGTAGDPEGAWRRFRRNGPKRDVQHALVTAQQGLCAYCEQTLVTHSDGGAPALVKGDVQIEHVLPRSGGPGRVLAPDNFVACCQGGTGQVEPPDSERRLPSDRPRADRVSCGQAKDDGPLPLDPRNVQILHRLVGVTPDGEVRADPDGCEAAGLPPDAVGHALEAVLNLNCARLRTARRARLMLAEELWDDALREEPDAWERFVARAVGPDLHGHLQPFWSAWRQVFGAAAEAWIADHLGDLRFGP